MGLPMLCQWLIITYGWRGTYIIFSGLAANLLAAAALLRPLPTDKKEDLKISDVINDKCHSCICRIFGCHIICASPLLLGILVGLFFLSASSHTFVTFLLLRVSDLGVEPMHASYLITILGASSFATRLLHGWFVDRRVISPAVIFIASIVLWGLLNLAFPVIIGYWWIACFCVLFGFSNGIYNSLHYVVVKDSVYKEHFTGAIGLDLTAFGLGCFVGIPIAGKLYDIFGSADVAFYCTGISALISAIVFSLTHILQRRHNNHTMRRTYQTDEKQHSENISMTCEDDKTLFQLISVM
ncbi:monocarboxylate transporter 12-B-like [Saccoglossus kowalevskii]